MKERPINYSTSMVLARRDGRKTMTRRALKPQPEPTAFAWSFRGREIGEKVWPIEASKLCPYGQPGDKLWVREEHRITDWVLKEDGGIEVEVEYLADGARKWKPITRNDWQRLNARKTPWDRWMRARFMLRSFSRSLDVITAIRVERLGDISGQDSMAEGIERFRQDLGGATVTTFRDYLTGSTDRAARQSFETLWQSINGPGSWAANPWVWVIEFQRIES